MTYLTIRVTDDATPTTTEYTHVTSYDVRENCVFIVMANDTVTILPLHSIAEIKVIK